MNSQSHLMEPTIVPRPRRISGGDEMFRIWGGTLLVVQTMDDHVTGLVREFAEWIERATGTQPPIVYGSDHSGDSFIRFNLEPMRAPVEREAYSLRVRRNAIDLSASTPAGLFYGIQTLRQLFPPEFERGDGTGELPVEIPGMEVSDGPRFAWRGLLLDCSRHFMSKPFILNLLDLMSYHKMNVFHWHLFDDQGWRLQIDRYPLVTEVGAWRKEAYGKVYGGFYTKDDVREIVAHAKRRFITVVPEVELPGHTSAVLAAYPHLSCHGEPREVPAKWGIFKDIYCAGKDESLEFLKNILEEVIELFPSEYIHIGGDEAPRENWKECPRCQQRIRENNLRDEKHLQTWFTEQIQDFLEQHNRKIIGWDELYEGGLPSGAILQHWRFEECLQGALNDGHNVIVSNHLKAYFNYPYDKDEKVYVPDTETMLWMPALGTERAYKFEPVPEGISEEKQGLILGSECTLWTEFIPEEQAHSYLFPRLCAFSEATWTPREKKDWGRFSLRLEKHLKRLDALGVSYYTGPQADDTWKQVYPEAKGAGA